MCGIAGILDVERRPVPRLAATLDAMSELIEHRGPDDSGEWIDATGSVGLTHRRLSIIDVSAHAHQPFVGPNGHVLAYNGEIYNYRELRAQLSGTWDFRSRSDTEVILAAYDRWGEGCLDRLRGMFAFALWDGERLFAARDRLGIKPFYWLASGDRFAFASEAKALLPLVDRIATDEEALSEYLIFQYPIGEQTLFRGIRQLMPGHAMSVGRGGQRIWRWWDLEYAPEMMRNERWFQSRLRELTEESIDLHLRSDVPVGAYVSGGLDSSLVAILASRTGSASGDAFHGKFSEDPRCDESSFAREVADAIGADLREIDMGPEDFAAHATRVIYHLDYPVAGPGSFPQFMVSRLAAEHVKVVLGGQGGDEIFGGYARYLIAYFEQCIRAALDGTYRDGNFVVTAESIIPNLTVLKEYTPLIKSFWSQGLFGPIDERYFQLIDRSADAQDEIDWEGLDRQRVFEHFRAVFNNPGNVGKYAYLDKMTHFDLKTLLPGLLHVEDRMSMAHGLESRVPMLDHPLVEFLATVPADLKFRDGRMKELLKTTFASDLPTSLLARRDKMGFPVPLQSWMTGSLRDWFHDVLGSDAARSRPRVNADAVLAGLAGERPFGRRVWGLLSLELWQREFHDREAHYHSLVDAAESRAPASTHPRTAIAKETRAT